METSEHHYTFRAEHHPLVGTSIQGVTIQRVGVVAGSPRAAETAVRIHFPALNSLELIGIEKAGDGCADDRCAVCHPSTRNRGL